MIFIGVKKQNKTTTHKQAIIYESGQANLKSNTQVVLMCTRWVLTGK